MTLPRAGAVLLIAWDPDPATGATGLARLERLVMAAAQALACPGRPLLVPRDEASVWAWLPQGKQQESRLDVELALSACRWLGSAVLQPPPASR